MSIGKKLNKQDDKSFKGLTTRQYMAILAIQHLPQGETTMVNIAKKLGTTKQNVNQLIPMLEKKGYVSRSTCKKNKNAVNIKITDSGLSAMLEYARASASVMTNIFEDFTEKEMETLLHLLRKLHCYDSIDYLGFENDTMQLFENEYSDLLKKILEEYKQKSNSSCDSNKNQTVLDLTLQRTQ